MTGLGWAEACGIVWAANVSFPSLVVFEGEGEGVIWEMRIGGGGVGRLSMEFYFLFFLDLATGRNLT